MPRTIEFRAEITVLGYREGEKWVAHCMEMDILGYGDTQREALKDLMDLITMQVTFAFAQGRPDLLYSPAPPEFQRIAGDLLRQSLISRRPPRSDDYFLTQVRRPDPLPKTRASFTLANA